MSDNLQIEQMIFLISFIYITVVGLLGFNYTIALVLKSNKITGGIKFISIVSLAGVAFVAGAVPYALVGTYVIAALQTKKQLAQIKEQIRKDKGDNSDDDVG